MYIFYIYLWYIYFFFFGEENWLRANMCCQSSSICLRKSGPDLTSVPIFLDFLYVGRCHSTAWQVVWVHAQDPNPWSWAPKVEHTELQHYTTRPAPQQIFACWSCIFQLCWMWLLVRETFLWMFWDSLCIGARHQWEKKFYILLFNSDAVFFFFFLLV